MCQVTDVVTVKDTSQDVYYSLTNLGNLLFIFIFIIHFYLSDSLLPPLQLEYFYFSS